MPYVISYALAADAVSFTVCFAARAVSFIYLLVKASLSFHCYNLLILPGLGSKQSPSDNISFIMLSNKSSARPLFSISML